MSIHSIFKNAVNESAFSDYFKKRLDNPFVNEVYDDNAVGWLTRNNILPQMFSGNKNGLRVRAALKNEQQVPNWNMKYLTYPFVGINGYSLEPAMVAKQGNYASYMRDNLTTLSSYADVKSVLAKQVSNGTGIPGDGFLIFPKIPIETASTRNFSKSLSVFTPRNKRDFFSEKIWPYNVQQAFSVDDKGNLYVDENKPGGVVLYPVARSAQRGSQVASSALLIVSKLNDYDLAKIASLDDRSVLAREVTDKGGMLHSYFSGARSFDNFQNGNQNYKNFQKFAEENGLLLEDGSIDVEGVRRWIETQPTNVVLDNLVKPYLLMTPFDRTYCLRTIGIRDRIRMKGDVAVFKALCSIGGDSFETNLEKVENGQNVGVSDNDDHFDVTYEEGSEFGESEKPPVFQGFGINESEGSGREVGTAELMEVCRKYIISHKPTFMMIPKERLAPQIRDDGKIRTKSEGVKRTFVRILTENTPFNEIDQKFCPKDFMGMIPSHSGVLDYSGLFAAYPDMFDENAPRMFKYTRIAGYMVSFQYDPELEEECKRVSGHGKLRFNGALNYYIESPNGVMYREPTIFDVLYVHADKSGAYGDFIFSGYATNGNNGNSMPPQQIVEEIESKGLSAGSSEMHSAATYGFGFQKIPYSYNKSAF